MCNHGLGKTVFWMQCSEAHFQVPAHFPLPEVWGILNNLSANDCASHAKCYECLQQQAPILTFCSSMKINLHMMVLTKQGIFALWCNKIHIEA